MINQKKCVVFKAKFPELSVVLAIYFFAVIVRYSLYLLMPYWSGDEYVYKSIALGIWHFGHAGILTNDSAAANLNLPNLLYPYLIAPAFRLGGDFYFGVRLINALVMNLAIFPCYLLAREFLEHRAALMVSVLSIAIPFVSFGAFAVTEVLFFPLFCLFFLVAYKSIENVNSIKWFVFLGVILGVLLNVRLTAMVLMPAYLFAYFWVSLRHGLIIQSIKRPTWLMTILAFLLSFCLLQYFLGVQKIASLGVYETVASHSKPLWLILQDYNGLLNLFLGHLTTLAIPYALPIAIIASIFFTNKSKLSENKSFDILLVITSVFSFALLLFCIIFTIHVSPFDLGGLGRWHSRYYFYFYPLVIIAGYVFSQKEEFQSHFSRLAALVIALLFLGVDIYFVKIHNGAVGWFGALADNMDVHWYLKFDEAYWFFMIWTVLLCWQWYKGSKYFIKDAILFVIIWVFVANYACLLVAQDSKAEGSDCGNLVREYLNQYPGRFIIVGDTNSATVSVQFWNSYIPEKILTYSDKTHPFSAPIDVNYLVVNGKVSVASNYQKLISIGLCAIYKPINPSS